MRFLKNKKKILKIAIITLVALPLLLVSCVKIAVKVLAPKPPAFPHFQDRNAVIADAQRISDQLEAYIKDWFDGKVPAELPNRLIPPGVDTNTFAHFTLRRPEETDPEKAWPQKDGYCGAAVHSIMDDEIITDAQHRYVIVFSREQDRPQNATATNGVTWVNWGPTSEQGWTLRWLSVSPEWAFEKTPHEVNLDWRTDWASKIYDRSLIGENSTNGFLGEFQPVVHYLSREQFEQIAGQVTPENVPAWIK